MGWPPCMVDGCDEWPSVGFTGCCAECIKDPGKVERVAEQMNHNRARFDGRKDSDAALMAWLGREPEKCLTMALQVVRAGTTDIRKAIELARMQYWATSRTEKV